MEKAVLNGADLSKADLTGAFLERASLKSAHLQGWALSRAHLKGALLKEAQLQGASLGDAQLQGASLDKAQLQGASLNAAHLQGASLKEAHLQGASLDYAQLQGASLEEAELQGASLDGAELQGASLGRVKRLVEPPGRVKLFVELPVVVIEFHARLDATDISYAFLWRTNWEGVGLGAVRLDSALKRWKRVYIWNATAYAELRDSMNSIPEGKMRDDALKRIERLDCRNPDKNLASCDPAAETPPLVLDWRNKLESASVDGTAFAIALAKELRNLVCANDANAIHVVRGTIKSGQLEATGREAPELVKFIMSEDCPVFTSLIGDDKANLLKIRQAAEQRFPPPPAPKKEK